MQAYRPRLVDAELQFRLEAKGAVLVEGSKWCGKTTTALQQAGSVLRVDDSAQLDQYRSLAQLNPARLLQGQTPRLLDEWQVLPQLWDAARREVDQRGETGQFIFTGSAVPPDTSQIVHSGTGRFAWLRMRTMRSVDLVAAAMSSLPSPAVLPPTVTPSRLSALSVYRTGLASNSRYLSLSEALRASNLGSTSGASLAR
ncbi:AAA family ATPase [Mobiluncus mulieris]|uniref:AAA family ATPase n=1 Tax=Mobiluncus mulieris TaxID=2052 RepID=UPI00207A3BB0|nr:AAA family ATPase [Mobiluncus mulieris]